MVTGCKAVLALLQIFVFTATVCEYSGALDAANQVASWSKADQSHSCRDADAQLLAEPEALDGEQLSAKLAPLGDLGVHTFDVGAERAPGSRVVWLSPKGGASAVAFSRGLPRGPPVRG